MLLPSGQVCPVEETNQMSRENENEIVAGRNHLVRHAAASRLGKYLPLLKTVSLDNAIREFSWA